MSLRTRSSSTQEIHTHVPNISLSSSELLVFQYGRFNQFHQRIAEQKRIGTIVEPERHFIKVGRQMFCRDFMPRTNDAALQERERGFDSVRRNVAVHVDAVMMIHGLVHDASVESRLSQRSLDRQAIRPS